MFWSLKFHGWKPWEEFVPRAQCRNSGRRPRYRRRKNWDVCHFINAEHDSCRWALHTNSYWITDQFHFHSIKHQYHRLLLLLKAAIWQNKYTTWQSNKLAQCNNCVRLIFFFLFCFVYFLEKWKGFTYFQKQEEDKSGNAEFPKFGLKTWCLFSTWTEESFLEPENQNLSRKCLTNIRNKQVHMANKLNAYLLQSSCCFAFNAAPHWIRKGAFTPWPDLTEPGSESGAVQRVKWWGFSMPVFISSSHCQYLTKQPGVWVQEPAASPPITAASAAMTDAYLQSTQRNSHPVTNPTDALHWVPVFVWRPVREFHFCGLTRLLGGGGVMSSILHRGSCSPIGLCSPNEVMEGERRTHSVTNPTDALHWVPVCHLPLSLFRQNIQVGPGLSKCG